jgi:putative phosphoesterase
VILGILSDTHGQGRAASAALAVLRRAGAEAFVHCGDVGGTAVLDELAGSQAWFVRGNTDEPGPMVFEYGRSLGLGVPTEVPLRIEVDGRTLIVFHGHELRFSWLLDLLHAGKTDKLQSALNGVDYVLSGHTHAPHDVRVGSVRFINPGAIYRARVPSVATLDLGHDVLRFWEVNPERGGREPALRELSPERLV